MKKPGRLTIPHIDWTHMKGEIYLKNLENISKESWLPSMRVITIQP